MFGSGIKALDGLAGELDGNAQSTFDRLNCEVSKHSSALGEVRIFYVAFRNSSLFFFYLISFFLMQLFKEIASEADTLVNDLQKSLHNQEEKLIAFAQQQREVSIVDYL